MTVIYDFGANTGSNIPYYLLKAETVVAVEANAHLVKDIEKRFASEIADGRLTVVNRAVTTKEGAVAGAAKFFTYQGKKETGHVWSSLVRPLKRTEEYVEVEVELTHPAELFANFGAPHFVKIDLEHHDFAVMQDIIATGPLPPYLSVEAHDPRVLGLLLLEEQYQGFKMVRGSTVQKDFADLPITTDHGTRRCSFPHHSAGPFGEDIPGDWLSRSSLVQQYGYHGPGWIDIHATTRWVGRDVPRPSQPLPVGVRELTSISISAAARAISAAVVAIPRRARASLQR